MSTRYHIKQPFNLVGEIPGQNYDYLDQNGAAALFGPGTVIPDSAR
jgi:methylmalonyl-CoA mutase cobalamin-binding subunit